ncbi:hypothetical protein ACFSCX_13225 [Bacillus salitolerans]|uniref:Uncharacterized protein n=1 Tax=Bacillus salitolerans TaxID=1437434 RepID=A0ABW4LTR3_9BACI
MYKHFFLVCIQNQLTITKKSNATLANITIYLGNKCIGQVSTMQQIVFLLGKVNPKPSIITIRAFTLQYGNWYPIEETHVVYPRINKNISRNNVTYKAGDILVGSDNMNGLPQGYMGHAALVVDDKHIIDSVMSDPIVRKVPIEEFLMNHPNHAHFRPKSEKMGQDAAQYAESYLKNFEKNVEKGIAKPIFYFTIQTPLQDEWTYIYCSKLVWLSYYYGASYEFTNDHLWFAPEDLYTNMMNNPDFELIYIHPDYGFYIDV